MDSVVASKIRKKVAPKRERLVVMSESQASHRGWYMGLMGILLLLSLGVTAYLLYERYQDVWWQSWAAPDEEISHGQQQAESERNRQQQARTRDLQRQVTSLQQQLEVTRVLLATAQAEKQDLEAEAADRIEPTTVTLPEAGLAITGFELSGEGKQRDFRLDLARVYRMDPALPIDMAVELRAAQASELKGTIRLVVIPRRNPNEQIYVPKESWRRDDGYALELVDGRQEIHGSLEIPEGGLRTVRVEVLIHHPKGEYTLIRRAFRLLDGG